MVLYLTQADRYSNLYRLCSADSHRRAIKRKGTFLLVRRKIIVTIDIIISVVIIMLEFQRFKIINNVDSKDLFTLDNS
jgi:hypothetical protein